MKKLKLLFLFCLLLGCIAYLIATLTIFNKKPDTHICQAVSIIYKGIEKEKHVQSKALLRILANHKIYPVGKKLKDINTRAMEKALHRHPFVRKVECYITAIGNVNIEVYERIPLLHIMGDNGTDYYIDKDSNFILAGNEAIHLPVATGNITEEFAKKELLPLAELLQESPFWQAQVQQIHVTGKKELELVPRVGEHILFLGKAEHLGEKLQKLEKFYTQALPVVGWNKYSRINIEFDNQIICTKK